MCLRSGLPRDLDLIRASHAVQQHRLPGWWKLNKDLEVKGRAGCRAGRRVGRGPGKYLSSAYLWLFSAPPPSRAKRQTADLSHQEVHSHSHFISPSFHIARQRKHTDVKELFQGPGLLKVELGLRCSFRMSRAIPRLPFPHNLASAAPGFL